MKEKDEVIVGILTFHRANNLGAVLQASALQNYIEHNIGSCEIIDFVPNNSIPYLKISRRLLHKVKQIVTLPRSIKEIKRERLFSDYRDKYLKLSRTRYIGDKEIMSAEGKYDYLISGSDQILNLSLSGASIAYYLGYDHTARKISYASSFGRSEITDEELSLVKSELPKFDAISVRESSAIEIITKNTGKTAELVLDPVFLMRNDEWDARCNKAMSLPKKYIFVYSMEVSDILEDLVKDIRSQIGMPVIVVRGGGKPGRITGKEDPTCGPSEFLRYIRDAEYIITNSFHGCAMSIIFGKKFLCIPHSQRNVRIENLLSIIGQKEKMLNTCDGYMRKIIDGSKAYNQLDSWIYKSQRFLRDSISQ